MYFAQQILESIDDKEGETNIMKKVYKIILLIILTLTISAIMPYSYVESYINAKTIDTSDAALKALEDQLAKIQQAKKENQLKLDGAEKDLLNEMQTKRLLDESLELARQEIENQKNMLTELEVSIQNKTADIDFLLLSIDDKYEMFLQNMKSSYEEGNVNILEVVLGSSSLPEFFMNIEYAGNILNYQQKIMMELNAESELLNLKKGELEVQNLQAMETETQLVNKTADLAKKAEKSANYLDIHRSTIAKTEANINQNDADLEKANQEFEAIIIERERQKALAKAQTYYAGTGELAWPVSAKNYKISSDYKPRVVQGRSEFHRGIDIPVDYGDPIFAAAPGKVVQATYHSSYGNYIMIDHGIRNDGSSLYTLYAHNSKLVVKVDDYVEEGQKIAEGGSTGYSFGNHCHFEVRINGATVNPRGFVNPPQ